MIALFPFHLSWDSDLSCLKMAFLFFFPVRPQAAPLLENYRVFNALHTYIKYIKLNILKQ